MIHVVGGCYHELCHEGDWNQFYGSGLRAACAIQLHAKETFLHTLVTKEEERLLRAVSGTSLEGAITSERQESIKFTYDHGLSRPHISPARHTLKPIALQVEAENVLHFGMVEGAVTIKADRAVYDPQSPDSPQFIRGINGSTVRELAVVCNSREASILTGQQNPEASVHSMLTSGNADVVVIKCGSRGAIAATRDEVYRVPAYRTNFVWPIGSGDVYAGAFAAGWLENGMSVHDAATFASKSAAYYCCTRALPVPSLFDLNTWIEESNALPIPPTNGQLVPTVYLAGPFFTMAERWLINQVREALSDQGMTVFSPYHDVGIGPANEVVPKDIDAIEKCNVVYAIADHFDSGTIFEVGYARSIGKPVVVFCQNESSDSLKMLVGTGCHIVDDFVTSIYRLNWLLRGS